MPNTLTPQETDTQLADLWNQLYKLQRTADLLASSAKQIAGAEYYYRGRQRVTDMTMAQAIEILRKDAEYEAAYKAQHGYTEESTAPNGERYTYHGTDWDAWQGRVPTHETGRAAEYLAKLAEAEQEVAAKQREIDALEATYTGWSRFFLVTSSKGHIHSSMHCSTCRPTTQYGWLPELSGQGEAEAVEAHGPALCSVCFPSAPLEWTAEKLTAARAARAAH